MLTHSGDIDRAYDKLPVKGFVEGAVIQINGNEIGEITYLSLTRFNDRVDIRAEGPLVTASPGFREAWRCINAKERVKLRLVFPGGIVSGKFDVDEAGDFHTNRDVENGEPLFWTIYSFSAPHKRVKFLWED